MAKTHLVTRRVFSEEVRRSAVKAIESGKSSVAITCHNYGISTTTVYRWLNKYSRHLQSGQTIVIQMNSEATKNQELQKRIHELEAALGRKQMEVDFLTKMIEIGKDEFGFDLKKKLSTPPSSGSDQTKGS
ncbi:transposase, partial [Deminuibacter soli]